MTTNQNNQLMEKMHRFISLMRRTAHFHHRQDETSFSTHHAQGRLLSLIFSKQSISQKELVDLLDIRPSSLSELLKKLESKELIERTPSEQDKRNMTVTLTAQGKSIVEQMERSRTDFEENVFKMLSAEERETFASLLDKITASWQEELKNAGETESCGCKHHGKHHFDPRQEFHGHHKHHRCPNQYKPYPDFE